MPVSKKSLNATTTTTSAKPSTKSPKAAAPASSKAVTAMRFNSALRMN